MRGLVFKCPVTGLNGHDWVAKHDEPPGWYVLVSVRCTACNGTHLVNPPTGKTPSSKPQD